MIYAVFLVVVPDLVADHAQGRLAFETVAVDVLLLQRPDHAFDHSIMLGTVRRDELLLQPVAAHQAGVFTGVSTKPLSDFNKKRLFDAALRTKPDDQRLLQGSHGFASPTSTRQIPA